MNQEETEKKKKIKAAQDKVIDTLIRLELAAQANGNSIFSSLTSKKQED